MIPARRCVFAVRLSGRWWNLAGKVLCRENLGLTTFLNPTLAALSAAVLEKVEALMAKKIKH